MRSRPHFSMVKVMRFSKTADDGGERREAHEHEKQRAPQLPQRHLVEHVGQRDEHERGALIGGDGEGEACGEDDEAREDGHGGVQAADAQGLAVSEFCLPMRLPKTSMAEMPSDSVKNAWPMAAYTASPKPARPPANILPKSGTR